MAFPVVESTATSAEPLDVVSHTVTLPAGIVTGDLILVAFCADGNATTITWPSGANDGFTDIFQTSNSCTFSVAWRKANGSEPATIEVTTAPAQISTHAAYRISGHEDPDIQPPEISPGAIGSSQFPDPDSITPTGGAADFLYIATHGHDRNRITTADPAGYAVSSINIEAGGTPGCGVAMVGRELNAASEDPGTFTLNFTDQWVAATVAVHPTSTIPATGRTHGMTYRPQGTVLFAAQRDDADGNPTNEFLLLRLDEFGQILTTTEGVAEVVMGRTKGLTLRAEGNVVIVAAQRDDPDGNPTEEYLFLRVDQFGRLRTTSEAAGTPVSGRTHGMTQRVTGNVVLGSAQRDDPDGNPTEQYLLLRSDEFGRLRMLPEA